jgi:acyl-CoA synthetase (AMP-forming)/AMP-acid ligase II
VQVHIEPDARLASRAIPVRIPARPHAHRLISARAPTERIAEPDYFDVELALVFIGRHRLEWVSFVPTMLQRVWRLPEAVRERSDLSSLRRVVSSGGPCPAWLLRAHIERQLARYEIPRSFEYTEGTLRDESGKLCRTALRAARLPKS